VAHDLKSKTIYDNQNRLIIKVDKNYGLKNGGLTGQMTHGHQAMQLSPFKTRREQTQN
jgi:hypothetical protein